MSIQPINSSDPNARLKKKISIASGVGFVAGTGFVATKNNWLYKGNPSDTFVKSVSRNLRKTMTSEELQESAKITKFLGEVVDTETNLESFKPQIRNSKELSDAIKQTPEEPIESAITRVFSQPDKTKVREDLINLQIKTISDKKADRNTALKLISDNFDAKNKKLVKSEGTTEEAFKMIKNTARKIQFKAAVIGGLVAGAAVGALCLITSEVPGEKKK